MESDETRRPEEDADGPGTGPLPADTVKIDAASAAAPPRSTSAASSVASSLGSFATGLLLTSQPAAAPGGGTRSSSPTPTHDHGEFDLPPLPSASHDVEPNDDHQYSEEELKSIATALSPEVSALLSDEAFENLLDGVMPRLNDDEDDADDDGGKGTRKGRGAQSSAGSIDVYDDVDSDVEMETEEAENHRRHRDAGSDVMTAAPSSVALTDDDGLHRELRRLAAAEDSLREELEMAGGFGMMLMSSPVVVGVMGSGGERGGGGGLDPPEEEVRADHPPERRFGSLVDGEPDDDENGDEGNDTAAVAAVAAAAAAAVGGGGLPDIESVPVPPPVPVMDRHRAEEEEEEEEPSTAAAGEETKLAAADAALPPRSPAPPSQESNMEGRRRRQQHRQQQPQPRQKPRQYTLLDHAAHLSVKCLPADLGLVSVPLLSREEVERLAFYASPMPDFHPGMFSPDAGGGVGAADDDDDGMPAGPAAGLGGAYEDLTSPTGASISSVSPRLDERFSRTTPVRGGAASSSLEPRPAPALYDDDDGGGGDGGGGGGGGGGTDNAEDGKEEDDPDRELFLTTTLDCSREYLRPIPPVLLRRLFVGLVPPTDSSSSASSSTLPAEKWKDGTAPSIRHQASAGSGSDVASAASDRERAAAQRAEAGGGGGGGADDGNAMRQHVAEAAHHPHHHQQQQHHRGQERDDVDDEPVPPVRTATVRIRPDVLCGAVMDAVAKAATDLGGEITKRQGGHLRCSVPGYWVGRGGLGGGGGGGGGAAGGGGGTNDGIDGGAMAGDDDGTAFGAADASIPAAGSGDMDGAAASLSSLLLSPFSSPPPNDGGGGGGGAPPRRRGATLMPPTVIDAQLVSRKRSRDCERLLLVRVYRGGDDDGVVGGGAGAGVAADTSALDVVNVDVDSMGLEVSTHGMTDGAADEWGGVLLREGSSLVQRMEAAGQSLDSFDDGGGGGGAVMGSGGGPSGGVRVQADVVRETPGVQLPWELPPTPSEIHDNFVPRSTQSPQKSPANSGSSSRSGGGGGGSSSSYVKKFGNILTSPLRMVAGYPAADASSSSSSKHRAQARSTHPGSPSGVFPDHRSATQGVSFHLRHSFNPTPSVLDFAGDGGDQTHAISNKGGVSGAPSLSTTIPSLSDADWPYVRSSWRLLRECLDELDSRDLSYNTLSTTPFGAFPSLPTLDVHYCSQIRLLCREAMILSLLKMASELESFAREAEYSCANLIQILRPTFESYGLDEPGLPRPLPLTAYPLDFQAPESVCPPWGQKVMEAMNRVAASSSKGEGSVISADDISLRKTSGTSRKMAGYRAARDAVALVVSAFQRQADEEQSARMGRKNVQVMDRLAKMQAHKRNSIIKLRDSYGKNALATKAADEVHAKTTGRSKNLYGGDVADDDTFPAASDQVPLVKCSIIVGSATSGTCYITAHQLIFVTQLIPILGGRRCHVVSIADVELTVKEASTSMLNPLSAPSIDVHNVNAKEGEEEVFSFVPALVAHRFKAIVDVVREFGTETPDTLKLSDKGGLMYSLEESRSMDGPSGDGPEAEAVA